MITRNLLIFVVFYMTSVWTVCGRRVGIPVHLSKLNIERRLKSRSPDLSLPHSGQFIRFDPDDSDNITSGHIQVYLNNEFMSVCTDGWEYRDAHVACKQLGFMRGAVRILEGKEIVPGTSRDIQTKMTKVKCGSNQSKLQECEHQTSRQCATRHSARIECRPNLGCPEDWIAGPTGCYQITPNTVTRREFAVNKCGLRGGHLLNIETEAEQDFLSAVFLRHANDGLLITGGIRTGRNWVWEKMRDATEDDNVRTIIEKEPIEYTKWFQGWQPGNISAAPSSKKKERCLYLSSTFQHPNGSVVNSDYLYWTNDNCRSTRKRLKSGFNYICERPLVVKDDVGCYNGTGMDYRGPANKTERGSSCMNWKNSDEINPDTYPDMGLGDHNYCRNPDGDEKPWCWVSQDNFGFCDIPVCTEETVPSGPVCTEDQFSCEDGSCIASLWYCDFEPDCNGKDDEGDFCDYKLDLYRKTEGRTISHRAIETYAGTTNETCAKYCLESEKFLCQSFSYNSHSRECFLSEVNSDTHKSKPSRHEAFYELKTQLGDCDGMFKCNNKRCIPKQSVCDDVDDCKDFSDESSCDVQEEVKVRLTGGKNKFEGRVEVKHGGEWGPVCDDDWDIKDATVICRMLGFYGEVEAYDQGYFGDGDGKFMLDDVECRGNETNIDQCIHAGWKTHDCYDWETAGVRCSTVKECEANKEYQCTEDMSCLTLNKFCDTECDCPKCSDEDVCDLKLDLVGGRVQSEGRIQISFGEKNGTVCDDNFDDLAANVVCKSLGYFSGIAVESSLFGPGTGIIWMDDVLCRGNEDHIIDCPHLGPLDNDCGHDEDVGVICRENNDLRVELVDGNDQYSGRVELIKDGERGTICDDEWDDADAEVICRMMGFGGGEADLTYDPGNESIHIFLDDVECTGSEESIENCQHSDWLVHNCDHSEDAGVTCYPASVPRTSVPVVTSAAPVQASTTLSNTDCYDGSGAYTGKISRTEDGHECQAWVSNSPQKHKYHEDAMFPDGSVQNASNYCRNPDGDPKLWCYTSDPDERWGYCNVPKCLDNCYTIASEYTGPTSQSSSGKKCQEWKNNSPHHHVYHKDEAFPDTTVEEAGNQCRAPDHDVTPWCYTTDSDLRWEYCDIPRCGGGFKYNVTCGMRPLQSRARRDVKREELEDDDLTNPLYRRKGKIVGGSTASYGMIPWQVSVRLKQSSYVNDHLHHCGGILIAEYWILSAAHCFRDVYKGQVVVVLGDHHTHKLDQQEQQYQVAAIYSHERYKRYDFDNDIALLKIRPVHGRGIVFNDYVQPACLPDVNTLYRDGQRCIISGWGVSQNGHKSSYLKAARVPLVGYSTCNKLYKYSLTPRMTCAGYLMGGTDSCAGDSGGPLVCEIDDKFTVLGITSFGEGCGDANSPGVYARVASFIPWIQEKLLKHS